MLKILLIVFAIGNVLAFLLYGTDESRARRGAWRISEKALLLTGFLVGAPGALLAMQLFRHKTRRGYFYFVNVLGLLWQIAAVVLLWQ